MDTVAALTRWIGRLEEWRRRFEELAERFPAISARLVIAEDGSARGEIEPGTQDALWENFATLTGEAIVAAGLKNQFGQAFRAEDGEPPLSVFFRYVAWANRHHEGFAIQFSLSVHPSDEVVIPTPASKWGELNLGRGAFRNMASALAVAIADLQARQVEASIAPTESRDDGNGAAKAALKIEAALGLEGKRFVQIANSDDSADNKMMAIHRIDSRVEGWSSPQWAELLGVSDPAVRQTPSWKRWHPKIPKKGVA